MAIDLKKCIGCYTCQVACKAKNFTPPGVFFMRVLKGETGNHPSVIRQSLPLPCFHCTDPECERVCPTGATKKREDGIVIVDPDLCIGCRYCALACPYDVRYFIQNWQGYFKGADDPYTRYARKCWTEKKGNGISVKCDFCLDRIDKGMKPFCVDTCPADVIKFGDLDDPGSEVSLLIKKHRGFQLNAEYGTNPSVYYLPSR
jgi:molybdopterin-containing oxidoreductase family iron-sulfur binding subunit